MTALLDHYIDWPVHEYKYNHQQDRFEGPFIASGIRIYDGSSGCAIATDDGVPFSLHSYSSTIYLRDEFRFQDENDTDELALPEYENVALRLDSLIIKS